MYKCTICSLVEGVYMMSVRKGTESCGGSMTFCSLAERIAAELQNIL